MSKFAKKFITIVLVLQLECLLANNLSTQFQPFYPMNGKPTLQINTMNEHESLEITCTSNHDFPVLFYPDLIVTQPWSKRIVSPTELRMYNVTYEKPKGNETREFTVILRKNRTLYGDSGMYQCSDPVTLEKKWMYIYVKSNESLFAETSVVEIPVIAVNDRDTRQYHSSFELPCQSTSPEYPVSIEHKTFKMGNYDNYASRGIYSEALTFDGDWSCRIRKNDQIIAEKKFRFIYRECSDNTPKITGYQLPYAVRNQSRRINCTMVENIFVKTNLQWKLPVLDPNRIFFRRHEIFDSTLMNCRTVINELEFIRVTDDDVGEIKCEMVLKSPGTSFTKSDSIKFELHDSDFEKFELLATETPYVRMVGEDISFEVSIDSYPHKPEILWFDPDSNQILEGRENFQVKTTDVQTMLKIVSVQVSDAGFYKVRARTPNLEDKVMTFDLQVQENPFIRHLENVKAYYMQNEYANVRCVKSPEQNVDVSWSFEVDQASLSPGTVGTIANLEFTSKNVTANWLVRASGNLTCHACVRDSGGSGKCYDARRQIFMTDVRDGFGIIPSKEIMMNNDSLELTCAASIYHFTDHLEWMNSDGSQIISGRINITRTRTQLTYRSILTINSLEVSDSKLYVCRSILMHDKSNRSVQKIVTYMLNVHVPKYPHIETNLNGTESIYSVGTSIDFWCYASEIFDPIVSWWKDNVPIIDAKQNQTDVCNFVFRNKSQELHIDYSGEGCSGVYSCRGTNYLNMTTIYNQTITIKLKEMKSGEVAKSSFVFEISISIVMFLCFSAAIYFWIDKKRVKNRLEEISLGNFANGVTGSSDPKKSINQQSLPYDVKYEFPKRNLKFIRKLGVGISGVVLEAEARGICKKEQVTKVAVKNAHKGGLEEVADELKIMIYLGKHVNLVDLLGACTKNISRDELLIITEYCSFGSLFFCLEQYKSPFINQINSATGKIDFSIAFDPSIHLKRTERARFEVISEHNTTYIICNTNQEEIRMIMSTWTLLWWAWQVTRGMEYLEKKKVLHRDLAARNILLTEGNVVKICDFGCSKFLHKEDYYRKTTNDKLQIERMAIEGFEPGIFSIKSDVWSFGVLLWEFFTLGQTPYSDILLGVQEFLEKGDRLGIPEYANEEIYSMMKQCWIADPKCRPSFQNLGKQISDLLHEEEKTLLSYLVGKKDHPISIRVCDRK